MTWSAWALSYPILRPVTSPLFSRQCVLMLNHSPVIDAIGREVATPRYLLYVYEEVP
jgi:hypothetical protein